MTVTKKLLEELPTVRTTVGKENASSKVAKSVLKGALGSVSGMVVGDVANLKDAQKELEINNFVLHMEVGDVATLSVVQSLLLAKVAPVQLTEGGEDVNTNLAQRVHSPVQIIVWDMEVDASVELTVA